MMTSTQVVKTSVSVTTNSPSQDYTHPDNHNLLTYDMTTGVQTIYSITLFSTSDLLVFISQGLYGPN